MKKLAAAFSVVLVVAIVAGCGSVTKTSSTATPAANAGKKVSVGFVTNGISNFWVIAEKGAKTAAQEVNAEVDIQMPPNGVSDQKRIVQNLLTRGVDGIAISPIDPANQADILNEAAAATNLITHDSDAPNSKRLCYIGVNNYNAGRSCGELVKQALPNGGKIMLFVAQIEPLNARLRRQGLIDELLDRTPDPARFDAPGKEISGGKYTILDTRTDQYDFGKAKALAEDAIAKYPDLNCMVGLYAYNPPKCLAAVKEAGKQGKITIVAFDEEDETLQGILDGHIFGTVVQNPYQYGYQSVKVLAALARGDKSVIPQGGTIEVPARKITKEGTQAFWDELKKLTQK